jgi:hypothetical protein
MGDKQRKRDNSNWKKPVTVQADADAAERLV